MGRMMRMLDIFTSIATTKHNPVQMIQRMATPYQLETIVNVIIYSSPRNKLTAIRILSNLIKIQLPFEVLEETINIVTRDPRSLASKIFKQSLPRNVELKESQFLRFIYTYILSCRHKMWNKLGAECKPQTISSLSYYFL